MQKWIGLISLLESFKVKSRRFVMNKKKNIYICGKCAQLFSSETYFKRRRCNAINKFTSFLCKQLLYTQRYVSGKRWYGKKFFLDYTPYLMYSVYAIKKKAQINLRILYIYTVNFYFLITNLFPIIFFYNSR